MATLSVAVTFTATFMAFPSGELIRMSLILFEQLSEQLQERRHRAVNTASIPDLPAKRNIGTWFR
jgi:hypothetical protein